MLQERRNKVMELLHDEGIVKVSELMRLFNVSIETVRRDLEYMEEHGMLSRVYGGAVPAQPRATEPSYSTREIKHFKEKKAIGEKAVELVRDEDVIAVDIGTTTLEFAKALVGKRRDGPHQFHEDSNDPVRRQQYPCHHAGRGSEGRGMFCVRLYDG